MPHKDRATRRAYEKQWAKKNRGKRRAVVNAWMKANPGKSAEYARRYRERHGEKAKAAAQRDNRKRKYGITQQQWDALFASQGFVCAICERPDADGPHREWCTDHCHTTGFVRGILCNRCNFLIGYAGDSVSVLRRAMGYLESPEW